jgi:hypothetical protein
MTSLYTSFILLHTGYSANTAQPEFRAQDILHVAGIVDCVEKCGPDVRFTEARRPVFTCAVFAIMLVCGCTAPETVQLHAIRSA